jgi:class 3 adenylate cyclase
MGEAEPGQVLMSRTVRDLVAGTDPGIDMPGSRLLRGMSGELKVFAAR